MAFQRKLISVNQSLPSARTRAPASLVARTSPSARSMLTSAFDSFGLFGVPIPDYGPKESGGRKKGTPPGIISGGGPTATACMS